MTRDNGTRYASALTALRSALPAWSWTLEHRVTRDAYGDRSTATDTAVSGIVGRCGTLTARVWAGGGLTAWRWDAMLNGGTAGAIGKETPQEASDRNAIVAGRHAVGATTNKARHERDKALARAAELARDLEAAGVAL